MQFFALMTAPCHAECARRLRCVSYQSGEYVVLQNDPGKHFFIVLFGAVSLFKDLSRMPYGPRYFLSLSLYLSLSLSLFAFLN